MDKLYALINYLNIDIEINDSNIKSGIIFKTIFLNIIENNLIDTLTKDDLKILDNFKLTPNTDSDYINNYVIIDEIFNKLCIDSEISPLYENNTENIVEVMVMQINSMIEIYFPNLIIPTDEDVNLNSTNKNTKLVSKNSLPSPNNITNKVEYYNITKEIVIFSVFKMHKEKFQISDSINLNKLDPNKDINKTKNLIEFVIVMLSKNLKIEPINVYL